MEVLVVFVVMTVAFILPALLGGRHVSYRHLRGTQLSSLRQVRQRLQRWQKDPATLVWGRFRVPLSVAPQHFLLAGTTRSGKTVFLRLLMQSVFPRIGQGESHRALVYDGKAELLNVLLGMKQSYQQVITFDPFDSEGLRWDIAADVTDDAAANQAARLLFPKHDNEHQPFFSESIQNLSSAIMEVFIEIAPGEWRLSHLLFVLRSPERIKAVLEITEKGSDTLEQFQHSGETWGNITATISNRIRDYEIVAALHDHAPHSFSMKAWNETESILVLQKTHECPEVMDAMNRVLFTIAKRRLLSKPPSPHRRTWLIFDELASIRSKEIARDLGLLLEQGASRNISVALAFQNIFSLRDEFGQHGADRLVALCSTKALLRFEEYGSAEWAAGLFGKQEVRVKSVSSTSSSGGASSSSSGTTINYQDQVRWVIEPSEFQAIAPPDPNAGNGITGFFAVPLQKSTLFKDTVPAKWVFDGKTLAPEANRVVVERPPCQQRLETTEADIERLLQGRVQFASPPPATADLATASAAGIAATLPTAPSAPSTPAPSSVPPPISVPAAPAPAAATTVASGVVVPPTPRAGTSTGSPQTLAAPVQAPPVQAPPVQGGATGTTGAAPTPSGSSFQQTNEPQVWDLANGTIQPVSIWSVPRAT